MKKLLLLLANMMIAGPIVINQPGQYRINKTVTFTPSNNDSIIFIDADDVFLDLANNVVRQVGGTGLLNGIQVAAGKSNVFISNGVFENLSGSGILIDQNCNNIRVDNIQVLTANIGFNVNSSAGNPVNNCRFTRCFISNTTNQAVLVGVDCANIVLDTLAIDNCASSTFAISFVGSTANRNFSNIIDSTIMTRCGSGIQLVNTDDSLIRHCLVLNSTTTTTFDGILIQGSSGNQAKGNIIQDCIVDDFTATGAAAAFRLQDVAGSVLKNCVAKNSLNTTTIVRGFFVTASAVDGTSGVVFDNCQALQLSGQNTGHAVHIFNSKAVVIKNCQALSPLQNIGAGSSDGFMIEDSNFFTIKNCVGANSTNNNYQLLNTTGGIIFNCTGNTNNNICFEINTSTNALLDSCMSLSSSTIGFHFGGSDNCLATACQATSAATSCFSIDTASGNCAIQNCTALFSAAGFVNDTGVRSIFAQNTATDCTIGFSQVGAIGANRYFLNRATNNTTNYSAVIPAIRTQTQSAQQGANLRY